MPELRLQRTRAVYDIGPKRLDDMSFFEREAAEREAFRRRLAAAIHRASQWNVIEGEQY